MSGLSSFVTGIDRFIGKGICVLMMIPETGTIAPDFTAPALKDAEQTELTLSEYRGSPVALYFYPKDNTPGCTIQAENLRDGFNTLEEKGIVVIGVSVDSLESHHRFAEKKELPFILVSDKEKDVVTKYGVWQEKSMYGKKYMGTARTTFLIDEKGVIKQVISKPTVKDHTREILKGFEQ
jgi:peroxiredoxin Q/BCP